MSRLRIGSLCTGYGGLDMAVEAVLGGELAWVADNDPGAAGILAHRFPSVLNLGDITAVDWAGAEPVDVLCAGFPCQDVSCAGARKGLRAGTRTGVWSHVARAIRDLRPPLVVLENVASGGGLLSAWADSDVESCPWCLGETGTEHALRAAGAVLGDLASLGFDAEWTSLPAAGVGCCHLRWRVFVLAWPAADTQSNRWHEGGAESARIVGGSNAPVGGDGIAPNAQGDPGRFGDGDDVRPGWGADGRGPDAGGSAPADAAGERYGDPGTAGERRLPAATFAGTPADAERDRYGWSASGPGVSDTRWPGSWTAAEGTLHRRCYRRPPPTTRRTPRRTICGRSRGVPR